MKPSAHNPSSHPIPLGTRIAVFRFAPSGLPHIEGHAVIEGVTLIPNRYRVKFVDERSVCERLVFPAFQSNPEALALALASLWRHEVLDPPSHDEFFPEHRCS